MFINKLEKKFGKYALNNLSLYIVITLIAGYVVGSLTPEIYGFLTLNPYEILHGQVWRLFTWILAMPSESGNILFLGIMLLFYYQIGRQLEFSWGTFRFNLYIFSGLFFTVVGSFVLYFVLYLYYKVTGDYSVLNVFGFITVISDNMMEIIGSNIGYSVTTSYILTTMFLGYATTFPEQQVYIYFLIPIKVKWMAYVYVALMVFEMIGVSWGVRIVMLLSVLNFIIFYMLVMRAKGYSPRQMKRRAEYKKKVARAQANSVYENGARHKCAVCGQTELSNPNLEFRYCSKCSGGKEYCQQHLFTHVHQ